MAERDNEPKIEKFDLSRLKVDEGSKELARSASMAPYLRFYIAVAKGESAEVAQREIAALPLEKRYVWRILFGLEAAFADFDSMSVKVDWETLSRQDRERVIEPLQDRSLQFCLFLQALVGTDAMRAVMDEAIRNTSSLGGK